MKFSLAALLGVGKTGKNPIVVTVYSRENCCCCRNALKLLDSRRKRYGLRIEEIDVDGDPELTAAHGDSVPVVTVNGKIRFRGIVNPALLERLLTAERRG